MATQYVDRIRAIKRLREMSVTIVTTGETIPQAIGLREAKNFVDDLIAETTAINPPQTKAADVLRSVADCNADAYSKLSAALDNSLGEMRLREAEALARSIRKVLTAMSRLGKDLADIEKAIEVMGY